MKAVLIILALFCAAFVAVGAWIAESSHSSGMIAVGIAIMVFNFFNCVLAGAALGKMSAHDF